MALALSISNQNALRSYVQPSIEMVNRISEQSNSSINYLNSEEIEII